MVGKIDKEVIIRIISKLPEGSVKDNYLKQLNCLDEPQESGIETKTYCKTVFIPYSEVAVFCIKCGKYLNPPTMLVETPTCSRCFTNQIGVPFYHETKN